MQCVDFYVLIIILYLRCLKFTFDVNCCATSQLINAKLISLFPAHFLPLSSLLSVIRYLLYSRTTIHKFRHQKISCNDVKTIRGLNSIRSNVNGVESSHLYGRTPAYRSPILVTVYEIRAEITFIVLCLLRATSLAG